MIRISVHIRCNPLIYWAKNNRVVGATSASFVQIGVLRKFLHVPRPLLGQPRVGRGTIVVDHPRPCDIIHFDTTRNSWRAPSFFGRVSHWGYRDIVTSSFSNHLVLLRQHILLWDLLVLVGMGATLPLYVLRARVGEFAD